MRALLALAAALLVSCGGGGAGPQKAKTPVIGFYGDSVTSGWSFDPRPVQRMTAMAGGRFIGVDYSYPAVSSQDARHGNPVLPFRTFAHQMAGADKSDIVVIRYGGGDAVMQTPDDVLVATLVEFAQQARAAGKTPVITSLSQITVNPDFPVITPQLVQRFDHYNDLVGRAAREASVMFIDLRALPYHGPQDMLDEVHPNEAYSDRIGALIVSALLELLE